MDLNEVNDDDRGLSSFIDRSKQFDQPQQVAGTNVMTRRGTQRANDPNAEPIVQKIVKTDKDKKKKKKKKSKSKSKHKPRPKRKSS